MVILHKIVELLEESQMEYKVLERNFKVGSPSRTRRPWVSFGVVELWARAVDQNHLVVRARAADVHSPGLHYRPGTVFGRLAPRHGRRDELLQILPVHESTAQ